MAHLSILLTIITIALDNRLFDHIRLVSLYFPFANISNYFQFVIDCHNVK